MTKYRISYLRIVWLVLFSFLITPLTASALLGGKIESFSADQVMISPEGKVMSTSKLYITPDAYRMDGMPGAGQQGMPSADVTVVGFNDKNKQYVYNHDKKLVFESDLDEDAMMKDLKEYQNVDAEKILGKEKVSGYLCVKKQVTTTSRMMGMTITTTSIIWESDKFDFPLRTKDESGGIVELRNIDTDKPSNKLFKPISGYKKVDNMMAVMGMDIAAMARNDDESFKAPPQKNMENVDMEELMAGMQQAMGGENADPEQMAQMRQIMGQAFEQTRQMDMDKAAADGLWQIIPKRPGDQVGYELKAQYVYDVVMGSNATFSSVCDFYQNKLSPKGWKSSGKRLQGSQGFIHFTKDNTDLMISSADDPGMDKKFKYHYGIKLNGPDL